METTENQDVNMDLHELRLARAFMFVKWDRAKLSSAKKAYKKCLKKLDNEIAQCLLKLNPNL